MSIFYADSHPSNTNLRIRYFELVRRSLLANAYGINEPAAKYQNLATLTLEPSQAMPPLLVTSDLVLTSLVAMLVPPTTILA